MSYSSQDETGLDFAGRGARVTFRSAKKTGGADCGKSPRITLDKTNEIGRKALKNTVYNIFNLSWYPA